MALAKTDLITLLSSVGISSTVTASYSVPSAGVVKLTGIDLGIVLEQDLKTSTQDWKSELEAYVAQLVLGGVTAPDTLPLDFNAAAVGSTGTVTINTATSAVTMSNEETLVDTEFSQNVV